MNPQHLLQHFDRISEAPDAVARLRRFILDLAVRGKLVEQDPENEPAAELLKRIQAEKARLMKKEKADRQDPFVAPSGAEIPFQLPNTWAWVPATYPAYLISDLGKKVQTKDVLETGEFPVVDQGKVFIRGYSNDSEKVIQVKSPIILFGDHTRETKLIDFDFIVGADGVKLLQPVCLLTTYYYLALQWLPLNSRGYGRHFKLLRASLLPLPPLAEQHRIVAKVDELMALCDQLQAAQNEREARRDRLVASSLNQIQNFDELTPSRQDAKKDKSKNQKNHDQEILGDFAPWREPVFLQNLPRLTTRPEHIKQLRQTILNLAVRGRLVPQDSNDEPASELLKRIQAEKARLMKEGLIPRSKASATTPRLAFKLPANWEAIRLDDVCNLVTSGSRGWAEYYADSGPKFVRAQNIRFGRLRLDDLACVNPPAKSEGKRTQVTEGDLLIVITGAGVTNPALVDRDLGEAYVSQHVALIKPTAAALSRWLLLSLMSGPGGRDELVECAYGAGKPGLNLDNIRSLNKPLPPLAEQHRIVAKVDELMALCDQLEAQLTAAQTDSRRLLEAVLHEALAA